MMGMDPDTDGDTGAADTDNDGDLLGSTADMQPGRVKVTLAVQAPATNATPYLNRAAAIEVNIEDVGAILDPNGPALSTLIETMQHNVAAQMNDPHMVTLCTGGCH